jgi:16S rRNA (adenine1518-N6/adenine1519-N6)-dimethyltransferase
MIKKPFNQIFNNSKEISQKYEINLNLRPQNLEPEMYYKLTKEYEKLRS